MKIFCYICGKIIENKGKDITLHTGCTIYLCKECYNGILKSNKEKMEDD